MVAAGLEAVAGELGRDELSRELAAALAGVPAFEQVVRQVLVVGADRELAETSDSGQPLTAGGKRILSGDRERRG